MDKNYARSVVAMLSATLSLYGCATASKDLTPTYVSPLQYQGYDCDQIAGEVQRISARVSQLGGRLDEAANNDKGIMAVGLILFWPILFAVGGTKQQEAEYSRLKGEYDALEQQAVFKKCVNAPRPATATVVPVPVSALTASSVAIPVSMPVTVTPDPAPQAAAPMIIPAIAPASPSTSSGARSSSKYMFSAERFAKGSDCGGPVATMNIASATYETFTIVCAKGEPMSIRCDSGNCRVLQ